MGGHRGEVAFSRPGREAQPKTSPAGTLILDLDFDLQEQKNGQLQIQMAGSPELDIFKSKLALPENSQSPMTAPYFLEQTWQVFYTS